MANFHEITTEQQLQAIIDSANGNLIVIDFSATWCGPCRMIAPFFHDLATANPTVQFVKVDVDEAPALAESYQVEAMPTFIFLKNGSNKIDSLLGANKASLEEKISKHK